MAVYRIGWKATVYHNEFIEASSLEEAQRIAEKAVETAPDDWMCGGFEDSAFYEIEACKAEDDCDWYDPTVSKQFLLGHEPAGEIIDCMDQHTTNFDGAEEMIINAIGDDGDNYDTEELVFVLFDITPDDYVLKDNYVLKDRYMYKDEFQAVIKNYML